MKTNRIGLVIVTASLAAIAAIGYVLLENQHDQRLMSIRAQGTSLVRALSGVPFEQLTPGGAQQGVMQVLRYRAADSSFAYVNIVDRDGRTVNEVAADGVLVPAATIPAEPSSWLGETHPDVNDAGAKLIEYHAPLFDDGELQGFIRLGYQYPDKLFGARELPFLAAVSLPVFLLVPLFYWLLRHEVRPVREANEEISRVLDGEPMRRVEISASGELGDFMQRFNRFVAMADERIHGLEQDQKRMITSTKLLQYRKNRVEMVLETIPEAVLILDQTGTITFANQKLAALFGVSQQTILDQPPQVWCDNPDVLALLAKYNAGSKGRTFSDTIRFNVGNVSDQSIVTKTYPLFSPEKPSDAMGTLIIFRDETQEALARRARGDFVAHLSHELKSPLNVLALYSESLLSEAGRKEEFRVEAANVIAEEVDRLSTLITGLLNLTQIESGSLTPDRSLVKLRDVAFAAFEEARHSADDRDYRFEFNAPREMNPVLVDKDLIRIAITNLLSNAVKYNRDGGTITLTLEETDDAVQIRVADSGIGVDSEDAAKIFDKFYRSPNEEIQAVAGHGLGLALTRQIIELHHGSLSIDQDRDVGAEFIINLWKETTSVRQAI